MPLYADDQYQWKNTWTEGTDAQDAVKSVKLDSSYFDLGQTASDPTLGGVENLTGSADIQIELRAAWGAAGVPRVTIGNETFNASGITFNGDKAEVDIRISVAKYNALFDANVNPADYTPKTVTVEVEKADDFDASAIL